MSINDDSDALARHRIFEAALRGERPMDWETWALPIYDVANLTPVGLQSALWAVDVLRGSFGDTFLAQAWEHDQARPPVEPWDVVVRHPVFGQAFWPGANSAPWIFANLIQLATQLELCQTLKLNRLPRTIKSMKDYQHPVKWIHGLLQLEIAGLGLRAGWQVSFEPSLGTGKSADVLLKGSTMSLLVETTTTRMSDRELKALQSSRELSGPLMWGTHDIRFRYGVQISGNINKLILKEDMERWLQEVEAVAMAVAGDGVARDVTGPTDGMVHITRGGLDSSEFSILTPSVLTDPLRRLKDKIVEKAEQAAGSAQPVWVRLEEYAGVWSALTHSGMSLSDKLAFLIPLVQGVIEPHPQLAGVVVAPAVLWNISDEPGSLNTITAIADGSAVAVRSELPYHRMRETILVARKGVPDHGLDVFTCWYADEGGWLDWALAYLGRPLFSEIVQAS